MISTFGVMNGPRLRLCRASAYPLRAEGLVQRRERSRSANLCGEHEQQHAPHRYVIFHVGEGAPSSASRQPSEVWLWHG